MKRILLLSAAFALVGSMSFASVTAQGLAAEYAAQGYTSIEVTTGKTQIKVEAVGATGKIETIYDTATGTVLKQETGAVEPGDDISAGIELRKRNRDFVKVRKHRNEDSSGNDDGPGHDANDDHGHDGAGHDANDDHGDDDAGHDANDDHDDDGADHDSNDDHGSGNSGRGRGGKSDSGRDHGSED